MTLFWHRNDLRTVDNIGLSEAADVGDIVPVFIFDPNVLEYASPPRVAFMLDALESLRTRYQHLGGDLVTAIGDPRKKLPEFASEYNADHVFWNNDYSGLSRKRDEKVETELMEAGVQTNTYHDQLFHQPGEISAQNGGAIDVYDDFWKELRPRQCGPQYSEPDHIKGVNGGSLPSIEELGFEPPEATIPQAGQKAARERLRTFCEDRLFDYETLVSEPKEGAVSRLSDHLRWGTISVRQVYEATEEARTDATFDTDHTAINTFQRQLGWRDYYHHVLYHSPEVVAKSYKSKGDEIDWRNDTEEFDAWKQGRTGFPLIDAGMRQLSQEAHMHNTVRVAVASFLTKYLQIDWRWGYRWFRKNLIDHNPANDTGGWQWAASTGINIHEYIAFDPSEMARTHDPECEYIKRYVPELEHLSPTKIHQWPSLSEEERSSLSVAYPSPIVDGDDRLRESKKLYQELYPDKLAA